MKFDVSKARQWHVLEPFSGAGTIGDIRFEMKCLTQYGHSYEISCCCPEILWLALALGKKGIKVDTASPGVRELGDSDLCGGVKHVRMKPRQELG